LYTSCRTSTALFSAVAEFAFENVTTSPLSLAIIPSAVCSPVWACLRFARRPTHAERGQAGIALAVDLSARPFYIKGSNHPKGKSFPRLVSDFGLADAIESGIVKIPRCHRMAGPQIFPPLGAHQGTPATG
jgi:hypothetical protein